jgi:hypothetical protein
MGPRDKTMIACMNCKFMFDAGVNPTWVTVTGDDLIATPVRDYYGTFQPECRRFPPLESCRFPRVQSDQWCGEWKPTDESAGVSSLTE